MIGDDIETAFAALQRLPHMFTCSSKTGGEHGHFRRGGFGFCISAFEHIEIGVDGEVGETGQIRLIPDFHVPDAAAVTPGEGADEFTPMFVRGIAARGGVQAERFPVDGIRPLR